LNEFLQEETEERERDASLRSNPPQSLRPHAFTGAGLEQRCRRNTTGSIVQMHQQPVFSLNLDASFSIERLTVCWCRRCMSSAVSQDTFSPSTTSHALLEALWLANFSLGSIRINLFSSAVFGKRYGN
jgi:hypothetical protein